MAVRRVSLEDISEKLDSIQDTLRSLKISCSCPKEDDLKMQFFELSRTLLKVVPSPPLLFHNRLKFIRCVGGARLLHPPTWLQDGHDARPSL